MVDISQFKQAMSQFITGVTVVTSACGEIVHGMTCNSFTSICLSPSIILISLKSGSRTAELIDLSRTFAVNLLNSEQKNISEQFSQESAKGQGDRFQGIHWERSTVGCPIFPGAVAHMECLVAQSIEVYDHKLFFGEVVKISISEGQGPLGYFRREYLVDICRGQ